jgi:hypothetical protein
MMKSVGITLNGAGTAGQKAYLHGTSKFGRTTQNLPDAKN